MSSLLNGALQAMNCLSVKARQQVLIITDRKTIAVGNALKKAADRCGAISFFFVLEGFGKRPLMGVPEKIREAVKKSRAIFFAAQASKKGKLSEKNTFRKKLMKLAEKSNARYANMIGINSKILSQGMNCNYRKLSRFTSRIYSLVKNARTITVSSSRGTCLVAEFNPLKIKWIIADGLIKPGKWSNLPDGEVFTHPVKVNGLAVIDASLGGVFSKRFGLLAKNPVTVFIRNSLVESVFSSNKRLEKELKKYLREYRHSNRIGEFALGTNLAVRKPIGNLLQDEKMPSVHIAFGDPYPEKTGAKWKCKNHCDGVMLETTVFVDGIKLMDKGSYCVK